MLCRLAQRFICCHAPTPAALRATLTWRLAPTPTPRAPAALLCWCARHGACCRVRAQQPWLLAGLLPGQSAAPVDGGHNQGRACLPVSSAARSLASLPAWPLSNLAHELDRFLGMPCSCDAAPWPAGVHAGAGRRAGGHRPAGHGSAAAGRLFSGFLHHTSRWGRSYGRRVASASLRPAFLAGHAAWLQGPRLPPCVGNLAIGLTKPPAPTPPHVIRTSTAAPLSPPPPHSPAGRPADPGKHPAEGGDVPRHWRVLPPPAL